MRIKSGDVMPKRVNIQEKLLLSELSGDGVGAS